MLEARETPPAGPPPRPDRAPDTDAADADAPLDIVCASCGHGITSSAWRTEVDGSHLHDRVNPHGFRFRIACYCRAPGCYGKGPPSRVATWFTGHHWQLGLCERCHSHLGWLFAGGGPAFVALIPDRLVDATSST